MSKWISILFILIIVANVSAQDMESLKNRHEELLQDQGDINFLTGAHHFGVSDNVPVSIFVTETEKCIYGQAEENEFYRTISASKKATSLTLFFSDRVIESGVVKKAEYEICFQTGERLHGYHVIVNEENSDLVADRANWMKLIGCVLKHAPQLYKQVKTCLKSKNFMQCLKIVGPGVKVYQCIKGKGVDAITTLKPAIATFQPATILGTNSEVSTLQLSYQTITFHWHWNYDTGLRADSIYKEMPNQIIGFDNIRIILQENAWDLKIETSTVGSNVAKISLSKVSFALVPRFWGSNITGTVRCIMQK